MHFFISQKVLVIWFQCMQSHFIKRFTEDFELCIAVHAHISAGICLTYVHSPGKEKEQIARLKLNGFSIFNRMEFEGSKSMCTLNHSYWGIYTHVT